MIKWEYVEDVIEKYERLFQEQAKKEELENEQRQKILRNGSD